MGSRLELNLLALFLIVAILPFFFKVTKFEASDRVVGSKKSTELKDFIQYDFNSSSVNFKLTSTYGEEIDNIWYLKNPIVVNDTIQSLTSKKSIVKKSDNIEFIDDVVIVKRDGKIYNSQKAFYDIATKIVTTPDKFVIKTENSDIINGVNMEYDADKKITKAKQVKAVFKLKNAKE